jgi:hypothetical protein
MTRKAGRNYFCGCLRGLGQRTVITQNINSAVSTIALAKVGQQNNQPIELNSNDKLDKYLNYIHNNPVEAGIVLSPEDYLYSSAINYAGRPETLLEVMLM